MNEFMISLNEVKYYKIQKEKKYTLSIGYDQNNSLENNLDFEWIYVPKNL